MSLDLRTRLICRKYPPSVDFSKNPTDYNLDSLCPWLIPDDSWHYSDNWQKDTAKNALDKGDGGGIILYDLVFILAKKECYNDTLPKLWDYSGFNNDRSNKFPQWNDCLAINRQGRSWAWYWLLCRWTIYEVFKGEEDKDLNSFYFRGLKGIPLLGLHKYINGRFEKVEANEEQFPAAGASQLQEHYIKLNEFENYLKKIDKSIPLPKLLFPEPDEISKPVEHPVRHKEERINADQNKKSNVFQCKPGTKWDKIKITVIDNDTVRIETPCNSGQFSYQQLGMSFKRSANKPKKVWAILKLFATYNGNISGEIPESARRILLNDYKIDTYKKLPDYTKRLYKHLKDLFGINDSIFKYHYNRYKEYITKIKFSDLREVPKSDLIDEFTEKPLHTVETEDVQNKVCIPDSKRFDV